MSADVHPESGKLASLLLGSHPRRIHLIGVAGSGMSGIAALLLALGHRVSGSDKADTIEVERLRRKGLVFQTPHGTDLVADADLVVHSSAIRSGNPAYDAALSLGKPMARRAEVLAAVMTGKQGIVVCGMHGKTTTSAMAAHVLKAGGLKPSHYVGAEIPILGTNARWDSEGEHLVAEGDESDGTLVQLPTRAMHWSSTSSPSIWITTATSPPSTRSSRAFSPDLGERLFLVGRSRGFPGLLFP